MIRRRRFLLVTIFVAWIGFGPAVGSVSAHAVVVRAEPAPAELVLTAPDHITIWFTEPLAAAFSRLEVLNTAGERVDRGNSRVDAEDPTRMSVSLALVPDGSYTVSWRSVSTVDGHTLRGSHVFFVGVRDVGVAPVAGDQPLFFSRGEPIARWLTLLGALAVGGILSFRWTVLRPAAASGVPGAAAGLVVERITSRMERALWGAILLFASSSAAHLAVQTQAAANVSLTELTWTSVRAVLSDTEWGQLWVWRMGLLACVAATLLVPTLITPRLSAPRSRLRSASWGLALALSLGSLLTLSLASHGAASRGFGSMAAASDFAHLTAAALWVGGLVALLISVATARKALDGAERRAYISALAREFSLLAVAAVGVLVITGLYATWAQVAVLQGLTTPYGWTLQAKLGLVGGLLAAGALNFYWVRPRLESKDRSAALFRRVISIEILLAAVVVMAVGVLTSLEPGRQTAERERVTAERGQASEGISYTETVDGTRIGLVFSPGRVGDNSVTVDLERQSGEPTENAASVGLRLRYVDSDLGATALAATFAGGGTYVAEDVRVSIAGAWQLEVEVRGSDASIARTAFRFEIQPPGAIDVSSLEPKAEAGRWVWAWQLVALGGFGVGFAHLGMRGRPRRQARYLAAAVALAGVVLVVGYSGQLHLGSGPDLVTAEVNPITANSRSLEIGYDVFRDNCVSCHGSEGRGNGPLALALVPPPADLKEHVPQHPDDRLFQIVRDGLPGTAMRGASNLTPEQTWHLMNYLRAIAPMEVEAPPPGTPAPSATQPPGVVVDGVLITWLHLKSLYVDDCVSEGGDRALCICLRDQVFGQASFADWEAFSRGDPGAIEGHTVDAVQACRP